MLFFLKKIIPDNVASRDLVGIAFAQNNLKFVHIKSVAGRKEVVNFLVRNTTGLMDADVSKLIAATINELKVKSPEIISIIPTNSVISKNIEVPSVDPKEIRDIINLQASRHTPYSREEIIVDYIDIGTYKNNYTRILLIIVAVNLVKKQFDLVDKAGFKLSRVFLGPEGIALSSSKVLKVHTHDSVAAILHADEESSDFIVTFKNRPLFIRSIPIGARSLKDEKDKYQVKFVEEVKKSLESYQAEDIEKNPNILVVTGSLPQITELETALGEATHIPTRNIPYLKGFPVSSSLLQSPSLSKNASFFGIAAPILSYDEIGVDLVPEDIKLKKLIEQRAKDLMRTGVLALAFFVLIFFILITKIYFKSTYLKSLDSRFKVLNAEAQKLESDFEKISLMKNYLFNRGFSLEVLTELYDVSGLDLELNDIRFDEQGKFSIRGSAESMSAVFSFVDSMEKTKYFKDVKTKYTTKRKESGRDLTDFEIACDLKKEAQ